MKKLICLLVLFIGTLSIFAQTYNWQAYAFCTRDNTTLQYSEWESSTVKGKIVLNGNNGAFFIYTKEPQQYTIISYEGTDSGVFMYCNDILGDKCQVRVMLDSSKRVHLYIDYSDVSWGYLIKSYSMYNDLFDNK